MTNVTKSKTNVPQTKENGSLKQTIDNEEPPSIQKLNTHPAQSLLPADRESKYMPPPQNNNFNKSGTEKIIAPPPHPRSSSTRVKPV